MNVPAALCARAFDEAFTTAHETSAPVSAPSDTAALEIILRFLGFAGRDAVISEDAGDATLSPAHLAGPVAALDRVSLKDELATRHDVRLPGEVYDLPLHLQPISKEHALERQLPVARRTCVSR